MKKIIITRKKKVWRPWVKTSLVFMSGVLLVSLFNIFSDSFAMDNKQVEHTETGVVVSMSGDNSSVKLLTAVGTVQVKNKYKLGEIISIDLKGEKIISSEIEKDESLQLIIDKYYNEIIQIRSTIKFFE